MSYMDMLANHIPGQTTFVSHRDLSYQCIFSKIEMAQEDSLPSYIPPFPTT